MTRNIAELYLQYQNKGRKVDSVSFGEQEIDSKVIQDIKELQETFKAFNPKIKYLKDHIDNADSFTKRNKMLFTACSAIPTVRRVSSLEDNIKEGNFERAIGLASLALVNLPEDSRDVKSAYEQVFKGKKLNYNPAEYQHKFSFFRGTLFEPIINKLGKLGAKLHKIDICLYDLEPVEKFLSIIGFKTKDSIKTGREVERAMLNKKGNIVIKKMPLWTHRIKGNFISKQLGRSCLRIPVLGVIAIGLLEIPSIIKAFMNDKTDKIRNGFKQTLKSITNITCIVSGISVFGAILARKGPAGSLAGMALGSIVASKASSQIKNYINKSI